MGIASDSSGRASWLSIKVETILAGIVGSVEKFGQFWQRPFRIWSSSGRGSRLGRRLS